MAAAYIFILLTAALGAAADTHTKVCRTSSHGAEPSATRYATTQQLQAAIDECSGDSCGRVVVDRPGAYLTASLRLSGCVHLELPAGVTLLAGSQVHSDVQRGRLKASCCHARHGAQRPCSRGNCPAALADAASFLACC